MEDNKMLPLLRRTRNSWPSLVDEFFSNDFLPGYYNWHEGYSAPAVNITEGKDEYKIDVAAPGLNKNDFKVSLDNNLLTISSEKEVQNETNDEDVLRREFGYTSFTRCFTLPESVDTNKIKASHKDGILNIVVPKREEAVRPVKEIKVS
jgi:HSP20 family protein